MKIKSISPPIEEIQFLNAGRSAGGYYVDTLPIHRCVVEALPEGLDAIVVTADLQGRELHKTWRHGGSFTTPPRLLGEVLPQQFREAILPAVGVADGRIGAILAGDFYTVPQLDKRGGTGDVTSVWQSFSDWFEWVVGVAGNHDSFGESARPRVSSRAIYLDATTSLVDGLRFAGLGGIIGNPERHMRRSEDAYCTAIEELLFLEPDVLVVHDGPNFPELKQRGSDRVRRQLEEFGPKLCIRGHAHWDEPLVMLDGGTQVLNVDARVAILVPDSAA